MVQTGGHVGAVVSRKAADRLWPIMSTFWARSRLAQATGVEIALALVSALLHAGWNVPGSGVDVRVAALVGMAAMFAGASRALLTSVVFAFETTRQPLSLLPLLGGCTAAFLISSLMMRNTIMTEKIVRRGSRVPFEYSADFLDQVMVRNAATREVVALDADDTVESVQAWFQSREPGTGHQGFPVHDQDGNLVGVITRREIFDPATPVTTRVRQLIKRPPAIAFEENSLREAADHMVQEGVGRLAVVQRDNPQKVTGWLTRSDLLLAHGKRLDDASRANRDIDIRTIRLGRSKTPAS